MLFRRLLYFLFLILLPVLSASPEASYSQENELEKASVLNEKVEQLYKQGRYTEALPLAQQILEIQKKVLGPEHPNTAQSLNNLAELYRTLGDYSKAEPFYKRALAIYEKVLGPEQSWGRAIRGKQERLLRGLYLLLSF